jgi:hypothetical protein
MLFQVPHKETASAHRGKSVTRSRPAWPRSGPTTQDAQRAPTRPRQTRAPPGVVALSPLFRTTSGPDQGPIQPPPKRSAHRRRCTVQRTQHLPGTAVTLPDKDPASETVGTPVYHPGFPLCIQFMISGRPS